MSANPTTATTNDNDRQGEEASCTSLLWSTQLAPPPPPALIGMPSFPSAFETNDEEGTSYRNDVQTNNLGYAVPPLLEVSSSNPPPPPCPLRGTATTAHPLSMDAPHRQHPPHTTNTNGLSSFSVFSNNTDQQGHSVFSASDGARDHPPPSFLLRNPCNAPCAIQMIHGGGESVVDGETSIPMLDDQSATTHDPVKKKPAEAQHNQHQHHPQPPSCWFSTSLSRSSVSTLGGGTPTPSADDKYAVDDDVRMRQVFSSNDDDDHHHGGPAAGVSTLSFTSFASSGLRLGAESRDQ